MTGLIGWWSLHETSGDTAYDLSGNQNHGEVNSPQTGVAGRSGLSAYNFDGTDNVKIHNGHEIDSGATISFSGWIYRNGTGASGDYMSILNNTDDSTHNFSFYVDNDNLELEGWLYRSDGSSGYNMPNGPLIEENRWYHVAYVIEQTDSGGQVKIYVDGELRAFDTFTDEMFEGMNRYTIGQYVDRTNEYTWEGKLNDLRLYNRSLTSSEVRELYEIGSRDLHKKSLSDGSDAGAVSRWKLNDSGADGSTAVDSWGGNDGSIEGAAFTDNSVRNEGRAVRVDTDNGEGVDLNYNFNSDETFSVPHWVYFHDTGNNQQYIGDIEDEGDRDGWWLEAHDDGFWRFRAYDNGSRSAFDVGSWTPGNWYFVVPMFNSLGQMKLYVNGRRLLDYSSKSGDIDNASYGNSSENLRINKLIWPDSSKDLNLDNVMLYNRELKPWEVFELYRWGSLGKDMRKELVNAKGAIQ